MTPSSIDSLSTLIHAAISEDVGPGDLTATYFVAASSVSAGRIVAREPGVVAGIDVAARVFREINPAIHIQTFLKDGASFEKGAALMEVHGSTRSILTAERTALNFLQRLCGIATLTRTYVEAVKPHPVQIWDTRKTTPGWRLLEKAAVKAGGGTNHRLGLYDHVMVKDNHLATHLSLEALQDAIDHIKAGHPKARIQLEADTLDQVRNFLTLRGVDMLLLDNMPPDLLRQAVALNNGRLWLEASGGITLATIKDVAATGINAISVGALTHSARALDLGLDFIG
ncbi:MAG TPA: carboxylating nicotinate-nucleotide diphosphorylase [Prosthecobacter sp.]|nr:carboxylating nicotinate-nucleotide diphosphorylase [Prosthecobacter sp.]